MRKILLLVSIIATFCCSGCMYAVRYDGEYRGKVYDGETKQPIEGAVVLGIWNIAHPSPGGSWSEFYDARETLTNKNGEFSISGQGVRVLSNMEPMSVMVFKSGYVPIDSRDWNSFATKETLDGPMFDKILNRESFPYKYKGNGKKNFLPFLDSSGVVNFPIRKMEVEGQWTISRPSIPDDKMPSMTDEINKERIKRGYKPYTSMRGATK